MRTNVPPEVLAELQAEYRRRKYRRTILGLNPTVLWHVITKNPDWMAVDTALDMWYPIDPDNPKDGTDARGNEPRDRR